MLWSDNRAWVASASATGLAVFALLVAAGFGGGPQAAAGLPPTLETVSDPVGPGAATPTPAATGLPSEATDPPATDEPSFRPVPTPAAGASVSPTPAASGATIPVPSPS